MYVLCTECKQMKSKFKECAKCHSLMCNTCILLNGGVCKDCRLELFSEYYKDYDLKILNSRGVLSEL